MISVSARSLASKLHDWRASSPAYRALADRIRLLVIDGRIAPGTRLPAERELAAELGVSRTTIAAAYAVLREDEVIESVRGSGSIARLPKRPILLPDTEAQPLDLSKAALPAVPQLADAYTAAAGRLPTLLGDSGFDPVGLPELRLAIADRYTARGLPTTPDQILVTIGAQHAIALLSRTLLRRGDRVLMENPTYPHAIDAVAAAGARIVAVPVDTDEGWDLGVLEQAVTRGSPTMAYLMPHNHNPTGLTMADEDLADMLALAAANGTTVVIDETMAELTIDGPNHLPAAAFGPAVLVGSVGKSVWGGVRVGWVRAEPNLVRTLVRARFASDLGTPMLEQLVVADLLPQMDEILAEHVAWLREGRAHLVAELERRFPEWHVPRAPGGLTTWVNLGAPRSSQLVVAARTHGLVITAGPRFAVDGAFERFLRLPFSYPAEYADRALDVLERAWRGIVDGRTVVQEDELTAVV